MLSDHVTGSESRDQILHAWGRSRETPEGTPEDPEDPPEAPEGTPEDPEDPPEAPEGTPEDPEDPPEAPEGTPEDPPSYSKNDQIKLYFLKKLI
ncbi:hypothetical protein KUCAC02_037159 [Chaenocephalus aceratus]|nr:hypothetical protein KUCAC02_037159 [Chaenocephalus aceratus]